MKTWENALAGAFLLIVVVLMPAMAVNSTPTSSKEARCKKAGNYFVQETGRCITLDRSRSA